MEKMVLKEHKEVSDIREQRVLEHKDWLVFRALLDSKDLLDIEAIKVIKDYLVRH